MGLSSTDSPGGEAPAALTWLWRDDDPLKTSQVYEQEPAEKGKPYFRVRVVDRE